MPQRIYFDESGFTGDNLLHPDQPYFSYASVATDDGEAKAFVESLIARYGIQTKELKGSKLVRFHKGRKALDEIFDYFEGRIKISISNKKFALACKLYEYIFEPCYASASSLFYGVGFHHFIANILYMELVARGAGAEEIFREFEELMRTKDESKLAEIFSSSAHPENSPMLTQIRGFAQRRADDIRVELASLAGADVAKWILDLTSTCLFTLLAHWGVEYEEITAVCDPSKPVQNSQSIFTTMVGRRDRVYSELFGQKHPITFNLAGPIEFPDSKATHGIQIADAVAAAAVYVFSGADCSHAKKWRETLITIARYGCVLPDLEHANPENPRALMNAAVLMELHSRAEEGRSLTEGMREHIGLLSQLFLTSRL